MVTQVVMTLNVRAEGLDHWKSSYRYYWIPSNAVAPISS
jgi:hypothetical protein